MPEAGFSSQPAGTVHGTAGRSEAAESAPVWEATDSVPADAPEGLAVPAGLAGAAAVAAATDGAS